MRVSGSKLLVAALASASCVAQAGKLNLDTRFDYMSYNPNTEVGKPHYSVFQVSRLKVDFLGQLNELTSGRVRFDVLKNTSAETVRDRSSSFVDLAYITRKLSEDFALTIGKLVTGMGGVEGSVSPGDMYLRSLAGDEIAAIYYPTGLALEAKFGAHELKLTTANVTEDIVSTTGSTTLHNTTMLAGLLYRAKFMDGMIEPNLSYFSESYVATNADERSNSYAAVGTRLNFLPLVVELDVLMNKFGYSPQAANDKLSTTSALGLVRYYIDGFGSVHAKYESTTRSNATSASAAADTKYTGLTVAAEYMPVKDDYWRAHLAWTQLETEANGSNLRPTEQKIYLGMRALIDILK